MTDTTETLWSVDGVSLQTYAYNITTLGDRAGARSFRGKDILIPHRRGTRFTKKVVDDYTFSLSMWVVGALPDGTISQNEDVRRVFDQNWRMLRRLLWREGEQFTLTKRFWIKTSELAAADSLDMVLATSGSFSLIEASAQVSFADGLEPRMTGATRATFTIDLIMNDPYFYSTARHIAFSIADADADNPGPEQAFTVLGDATTERVNIRFDGPFNSARITKDMADESEYWLEYTTSLAADTYATIDTDSRFAQQFDTTDPYTTSGYVRHVGSLPWFELKPGETALELSAASGTGFADLYYFPAWF